VSDISRINKKLSKPLQMNHQLVADLQIKLAIYEKE
jgi:hypothetical protein